jgi:hypothetical protein
METASTGLADRWIALDVIAQFPGLLPDLLPQAPNPRSSRGIGAANPIGNPVEHADHRPAMTPTPAHAPVAREAPIEDLAC